MQGPFGLHIHTRRLKNKPIQRCRPVLAVPPIGTQLSCKAKRSVQRNGVRQGPEPIDAQLRLRPITLEPKRQIAVLIQFLEGCLQSKGAVETHVAAQGSHIGPVSPSTVRDFERVPATTDSQLRRLQPVLHGLATELRSLQRQPAAAVGLSSTPTQAQIATKLPLHLNGELQRQQALIASQLNPFQLGGELKFRADPTASCLDGDTPPVWKHELEDAISPVLIKTDAGPTSSCQAETRRVDLDPGGVAETHLQIQAGWVALLWEGSWNPVTALVIAP